MFFFLLSLSLSPSLPAPARLGARKTQLTDPFNRFFLSMRTVSVDSEPGMACYVGMGPLDMIRNTLLCQPVVWVIIRR